MGTPNLIRDHKLQDVRPARGRVLIKLHGVQTVIAQVNQNELEPEGEVLAVGPGYLASDGRTETPYDFTVGDMVMLNRGPVTPIKVDGAVCFICQANMVDAITGKKGNEGEVSQVKILR